MEKKKSPNASIARGHLTNEAKVLFYFLNLWLMPSKHVCTVRQEEAILLYCILNGYKISFGNIIENSILGYKNSKLCGHMPHPSIITHLCLKGGVTFGKHEEEKCPIVPHLTLTAITKNLASKVKKSLNEAQEERGDKGVEVNIIETNNQALVVSTMKIRNERERSASSNWVISPKAATHQNEQAESSRQQGNNSELLEMLRRMEQRMLERDIQLRAQLEKRDQYFEEEIRKRDFFMNEAIKQRDA